MKAIILNELRSLLEKRLNKIKKLGAEVSISYGEPFVQNNYEYVEVDVNGFYKIGDWEFVASMEWNDSTNSNVIKGIDGVEVPSVYYNRNTCDHCSSNRARKYTVILRSVKNGEFKQVGRGCLKEFSGINIGGYASYLSFFESIEEYLDSINQEYIGRVPRYYDVKDILEQTVERVKDCGYITQSMIDRGYEKYGEEYLAPKKTSSAIYHIMFEDKDHFGNLIVPRYVVHDGTDEIVKEIYNAVEELEENNSWCHNVKTLLGNGFVKGSDIGLVVSAYSAYQKALDKKEEEKEDKPVSNWIDNIGDKIEFTARPTCIYSFDSQYGYVYVYKFVSNNDVIIWKTSKNLDEVEMTVKATVKDHSEFRGVKQTEITRGKVLSTHKAEGAHAEPTNAVEDAMSVFYAYMQ